MSLRLGGGGRRDKQRRREKSGMRWKGKSSEKRQTGAKGEEGSSKELLKRE